MGANLAAWNPPDDIETEIPKYELERLLGEHFDEEIFYDMACENDWITVAEFMLILGEFIDVDTFFPKKVLAKTTSVPEDVPQELEKSSTAKSRFKTSAELVKSVTSVSRKEKPDKLKKSGLSIKATAQKIRAFFVRKEISIPDPPSSSIAADDDKLPLPSIETVAHMKQPPRVKEAPPPKTPTRSEAILNFELQRSKEGYSTWGKEVVYAIDADNPAKLIRVFKTKKHLGAELNEQTSRRSYGGYAWTVWMHKYLGDTALHLAIKQRKMGCLHALLVIGADTTVQNGDELDPEALAKEVFDRSLHSLRQESEAYLIGVMHPRDYHLLPDKAIYRHLDLQAWRLMEQGRCEYEALPKSTRTVRRKREGASRGDAAAGEFDPEASVDDRTASSLDGGGAGIRKITSAVSLLSSANDTFSSMSAATKSVGSTFCFNDVADVVEMVTRQNHLAMRLEREERLKQSGLSLLADKGKDGDEGSAVGTVSGVAQRMIVDAHKSLSSFAALQRVLQSEGGAGASESVGGSGPSEKQWKTCLDMPYRHITKLSTRTNMLHMNIGDEGIMRISRVLPGNARITDLVLANARITCIGLKHLCDAMMFLPNLRYVDLSQNCIADTGAAALADVLSEDTVLIGEASAVERVSLMGNRISLLGAKQLVNALAGSSVSYLNLCRNRISQEGIEELKSSTSRMEKDRKEKLATFLSTQQQKRHQGAGPESVGGEEGHRDGPVSIKSERTSIAESGLASSHASPQDSLRYLSTPKAVLF